MLEKVQIWVDKSLKKELQDYCANNETNISNITRKYWKDLLKNKGKEEK